MHRPRHRRIWITLAGMATLIAAGIAWRVTRETPEDLVTRLGGTVMKTYFGSEWFEWGLRFLPGGERVMDDLGTPVEANLTGTQAGDEHARQIAQMRQLHTLRLDGTRITDATCKQLATLRELRMLTLSQTEACITSGTRREWRSLISGRRA